MPPSIKEWWKKNEKRLFENIPVNNPNNYSQSLDISNIHTEFRFTGSLSKSDMATEIDTNF